MGQFHEQPGDPSRPSDEELREVLARTDVPDLCAATSSRRGTAPSASIPRRRGPAALARPRPIGGGPIVQLAGRDEAPASRRKLRPVSEQPHATPVLEELARDQNARPVANIEELRANLWSSDEELDEFLADWRASRDSSLS